MTKGAAEVGDTGTDGYAQSLLAACYTDMRRLARRLLSQDGMQAVLQPTDLANEAAIRLINNMPGSVNDQGHMLAIAARSMRQVLIDEARKSRAAKRQLPAILTEWPTAGATRLIDIETLDAALAALARFSPQHAEIVELRFSLGLTIEETSAHTGIPERTVKRRWQAARAWLQDHLGGNSGEQD